MDPSIPSTAASPEADGAGPARTIDVVADAIIRTDAEFQIVEWSESAARLYGWSASEAVGRSMAEVVPTRYIGVTAELVRQAFLDDGEWSGLVAQTRKDGAEVFIDARVRAIVDASGARVGAVAVNRPYLYAVAPGRAEAAAIAETRSRELWALIESAPAPMAVFDAENRFVAANQATCTMLGADADTLRGRDAAEVYADPEQARRDFAAMRAGDRGTRESMMAPLNGERTLLRWRTQPIVYDGAACLLGLGVDVTAEVATAEARERDLTQVWEIAPGPISIVDEEGRWVQVNRAVEELFGRPRSELLGARPRDYWADPDDAGTHHALEAAFRGEVVDGETAVARPDGERRTVRWRGRRFSWRGQPCVLVIGFDVTEQLRATEAAAHARAQEAGSTALREAAFQTLSEGIVVVSPDGQIDEANASAARILGIELDALLHEPLGDPRWRMRRRDGSVVSVPDFPAARTLQTGEAVRDQVLTIERPDLEPVVVRVTSLPLALSDGRTAAVVSFADITEFEASERRAATSEARLASFFSTSPVAIALLTVQGHLLDLNPAGRRLGGVADRAIEDRHYLELLHPDDRPRAKDQFAQLLKTGRAQRTELRLIRPDGGLRHVLIDYTLVEAQHDEPPFVAVVFIDVSDRVEARRRVTQLFDDGPSPALVVDAEGRIVEANERFTADLGGDTLGTSLETWWRRTIGSEGAYEAWRARWQAATRASEAEGAPVIGPVEVEVTDNHGEPRLFEVRRSRGHVPAVLTLSDVTVRRQAQARLNLLGTAMHQADEAIVISDARGMIEYVNPAFERATGYSTQEVLGRNPRVLKSGKHPPEFYASMWATLTRGEVWQGRLYNRRKDGELFHEEAVITPIVDDDGEITHYLALKRDVTREVDLERQLRQSQKLEALGQLAGGVAHDFNNLLGVIMGSAELMALDHDEGVEPRELTDILQAGERAASITKQLLLFSRAQQGEAPARVDLNSLLKDSAKLYRRFLDERVEFVHHLQDNLPAVRIDPTHLAQVVMNMTVNARDAMPLGGHLTYRTRRADVRAGEHPELTPGPYVVLEVADDGAGMSPQTRDHVFEPFFTTKAEGKGTGLGLATCYGIARQAGGTITVQSEAGEGTTFSIFLPAVAGPRGASAAPRARRLTPGQGRVLLAEDNAPLRAVMATSLRRAGYEVVEAADGDAAIVALREGANPDLVVSDLVMPRVGGVDVAKAVRAHLGEGVPVLLISGYAESVTRADVEAVRAAFMTKPFTMRELTEKLQALLQSGA